MLHKVFRRFELVGRAINMRNSFTAKFGSVLQGLGEAGRLIDNAECDSYSRIFNSRGGLLRLTRLELLLQKWMTNVDTLRILREDAERIFTMVMEGKYSCAKALIAFENIRVLFQYYSVNRELSEYIEDLFYKTSKKLIDSGDLDNTKSKEYLILSKNDRINPSSGIIETLKEIKIDET